jgi:hypothetical protein
MRVWLIATVAAAPLIVGCGSGARQDAHEPSGNFPVRVTAAKFPASQRLAEHTHMVISVTNAGQKAIPNIAVTIINPRYSTAAQAFARDIGGGANTYASRSRPVWIIDRPPGPCGFSCQNGGQGSAVTAYSNTWALGRLAPGQTATFDWGVTAVTPGAQTIRYLIAAGLNGKAKAIDASGHQPTGTFHVVILKAPQKSYVNDKGQVVTVR